jgi:transcription termination factor Rho
MAELEGKNRDELEAMAKESGIMGYSALKKAELVQRILQVEAQEQGNVFMTGILEIISEGYGFLRQETFRRGANDVYVSNSQIRRFNLRDGDAVFGQARPPKEGEKYYGLLRVESINGLDPELGRTRRNFASLTPTFPDKLIDLETTSDVLSTRLINLVTPIGRGQRGLIVSPPKAGKTVLLQTIANAISTNYDDIHLMVCLIGERPEEVTDMKRSVKAEVVAATFDEPVESQTRVAELALERAKRLLEMGKDVVILLDGITRLTRAYNLGSRMDDLIYEEFKGTGNMELHLDRKLAERRTFPAINIVPSSTRREELLLDENTLKQVWLLRRVVGMIDSDSPRNGEATQRILERLAKTKNNAEFLATLSKDM